MHEWIDKREKINYLKKITVNEKKKLKKIIRLLKQNIYSLQSTRPFDKQP